MVYLIITCRSLIWLVSSIGAFMLTLSAIATPKWLIGKEQSRSIENRTVTYSDTLGLYNRCSFRRFRGQYELRCYKYARSFPEIPSAAWRACVIFLGVSIVLLGIACLFGIIGFCKQLIGRKSLVNLAGTLQAFAGIFMIIVVVVYPVGWKDKKVKLLCHDSFGKPRAYELGSCSMGSAYFCAIGAVIACFACSLFSFVADKAVFSKKVQDEILHGKHMIFLP